MMATMLVAVWTVQQEDASAVWQRNINILQSQALYFILEDSIRLQQEQMVIGMWALMMLYINNLETENRLIVLSCRTYWVAHRFVGTAKHVHMLSAEACRQTYSCII